jgi:hypothetical protein
MASPNLIGRRLMINLQRTNICGFKYFPLKVKPNIPYSIRSTSGTEKLQVPAKRIIYGPKWKETGTHGLLPMFLISILNSWHKQTIEPCTTDHF